jgi:transcription antitermination factor NusG
MPILAPEPSLYPEGLLNESSQEPSDRRWWVLYTKAQQEKAVARHLLAQAIPFYLPLVKKASYRRGRRFRSLKPLFSGYVFLYGSDEDRVSSLKSNRISRVLPVHEPERFRHELYDIERLIRADMPLTIEQRISPGQRVRVYCGPLAGVEGVVERRRGGTQLIVSVHFLQKGASVEIDDFMLEPIG